ncbi:putative glutathione-S-transferase theta, GST [Dactylonectria macrodidyma]|uniref:glutathione transferase n=1 Tax=Dactylonectria macrodidyma TaxID=307937 RepID=A0A9P9D0K3_9HYPO|nr:putative glutathione-S-transferase theta, GST [Dactylonectria macrodidyma]
MSLKLYGHHLSLCTRRVLLVLAEKGVEVEFEVIDFLQGEHKQPHYVRKHPFAVIPLLEDGGFRLFAKAIARYLATKHKNEGTSLIPNAENTKARLFFNSGLLYSTRKLPLLPEMFPLLTILSSMKGIHADTSLTLEAVKKLYEKLDVLYLVLADQQYIGGQTFSLIDIFYMPVVDMLFQAGEGGAFKERPNLGA